MPAVKQAQETYKDKGFVVVGMDHDPDERIMNDYLKEKGFDWPQWFLGKEARTVDKQFWIAGYPTNILIDRDGKIVSRALRFYEKGKGEAEIEKALQSFSKTGS